MEYGTCEECKQKNTEFYWCNACNAKRFQQNFKNWTSGGFGKVYKANWIDGRINKWDDENQNWERLLPNMDVALKNPDTKNYMMVLHYAENGSLRNYLDTNVKLSWEDKIDNLLWIVSGLKEIHANELIHRDLHIGNILKSDYTICITDMGLCKPADYNATENTKNIISGLPPYHDVSHNQNLALKICQGLRPSNVTLTSLSYETHSEAIYTSRLLNFNNLSEPKNSDDYYKQYDNIISTEYSENLQIDISQLKINEDDQNNESKSEGKI
ncbi:kinase-like domain-containing protein [Glomus cerebriforme]|uniref:Kinase-like domain-containing protein n=1 Tax=Glomus cerebriforme TaxID=658196 RepID=A0A397S3V0_9GLOM|nr:kinase-like domain-containing protein [Glomus cerebriforme]